MRRLTCTKRLAAACLCAAVASAGPLLVAPPAARAAGPGVWAITGARIVTVSGPPIERGTVVVRDGLIADVGATVPAPADARVIDGTGLTVYPGLIDASAALDAPAPAPGGGPQAVRAANRDDPPGVEADREAFDMLKPGGRDEALRAAGVTTVLAVPSGGIFVGRSALVNLNGGDARRMTVKTPVALHVAFDTQGGFVEYPNSLMGVISVIRQKLLDAQHYKLERARYDKSPRGHERPPYDKDLEALVPALDRAIPVVFYANTDKAIRRAIRLADEFNLRYMIAGGAEAWKSADLLKADDAAVLVTLGFPDRDKDADALDDVPLRVLRMIDEAPSNAARLQRAGVRFGFESGAAKTPAEFLAGAAKAVAAGLPHDEAIRDMTLSTARILGVEEQLGSVEKGKIANLVVANGDIFDKKTKVRYVFVDGTRYEFKEEAAPKSTATPSVDATGTWSISVNAPGQKQDATLALKQSGTDVTGTLTGQQIGTVDIKSGVVSGNKVSFSVSISPGGTPIDISFTGTIEGNSMTGSVTIPGAGAVDFSGTRPQQEREEEHHYADDHD